MKNYKLPLLSLLPFFISILTGCTHVRTASELPFPSTTGANFETDRIQKSLPDDEIRPGFLISVRHPSDAKLQVEARVGMDSVLSLPYNRKIQTEGLNLVTLRGQVQKSYSDLYQNPQEIQIQIVHRKFWIEVRGVAKKSGSKLIEPKTKLEEIIQLAETGPETIDFARIELNNQVQWIDLRQYSIGQWPTEKLPIWNGGETIWLIHGEPKAVAGALNIRILGEVKQPGNYSYQEGQLFIDYLSQAGGPLSTADLEKIYIYRPSASGMGPGAFSALEPQTFRLAPGDTIIIASSLPNRDERRFQMGANLAAIISAIGVLIIAF